MGEDIIDQSQLAESVSSSINYEPKDMFLVKPLDKIKVMKEFSTPVVNDTTEEPTENEDGVKASDYDTVATETKEVDSDYRKAIVLKVPFSYASQINDPKFPTMSIVVGDTIVYRDGAGRWFDLLKDSQFVSVYDVVAKEVK